VNNINNNVFKLDKINLKKELSDLKTGRNKEDNGDRKIFKKIIMNKNLWMRK